MQEELVKIKGKNDRIEIILSASYDYYDLRKALFDKLGAMAKFFDHSDSKVYIAGKHMTEGQKREIASVMRREHDLCDVEFCSLEELIRLDIRRKEKEIIEDEGSVFIIGDIQGGQKVRTGGDITVVGNVNPGAEIVADGNICIMGALWGNAIAGNKGDTNAIIVANVLEAERLQIGSVIGVAPGDDKSGGTTEVARIEHGLIVVEEFDEYKY